MTRILVVDDDPLVVNAIRAWLEDRGFEIATAERPHMLQIVAGAIARTRT